MRARCETLGQCFLIPGLRDLSPAAAGGKEADGLWQHVRSVQTGLATVPNGIPVPPATGQLCSPGKPGRSPEGSHCSHLSNGLKAFTRSDR